MNRITILILVLLSLAACGDGQPFFDQDGETTENSGADSNSNSDTVNNSNSNTASNSNSDTDSNSNSNTDSNSNSDASGGDNPDGDQVATDVLDTGTVRPPQAANAVSRDDISRAENPAANPTGGLVASVSYDSVSDTLIVDGLGFDGANTYSRGAPISQLGAHQVYEADIIATDSLTNEVIGQIQPYRAVYGVSENSLDTGEPRTSFAIVRSGGFSGYGFGGYLYERNGSVVIPTSGQAQFSGSYAGIRVFQNRGGLELTRGDVVIAIDLRDFNANNAIRGSVSNRVAFANDGTQIPTGGTGELQLPTLRFVIEAGGNDLLSSGEFSGELNNAIRNDEGALELYEQGNYYGILSGDATDIDDGGEIVGIIVVESEDPRYEGVNVQETGGFIAYR